MRALAAAAAVLALVGCAETTVDPVDTTTAPIDTTPATAPTGTTEELLERLIDETTSLSELVIDGGGADQAALARIEALWTAAQPGIEAERPDLLEQFDDAMDYARRAVERRRPADADKAAQNLRALTNAL